MGLLSSLSYALRGLRSQPGTTLVTLSVLAIGIGLVAAVFSVADGILWRSLDFAGSSRVVSLVGEGDDYPPWIPLDEVRHLEQEQTVFEAVTAYTTFFNLITPDSGASWSSVGSYVTSSFFDLLPVPPILGRRLHPADDVPGAPQAAILSHRVWQRRLGGDPQVIGRSLTVNGRPVTIVGVLPAGVHFPYRHDLWLSVPFEEAEKGWHFMVAGRLRPGVTVEAARSELGHLGRQLDSARPRSSRDERRWSAARYTTSTVGDAYRTSLLLLLAAVSGVLLVVCLNVANLRLVQAVERSGELAIRRALGAGRRQLLGLVIGEIAVLIVAGAIGGLLLAHGFLALYRTGVLPSIGLNAYWIDARLDARALLVAAGAAAGAALLGGVLPALGAMRSQGGSSLAEVGRTAGVGGPGRVRLRRALVVAQVALAAALLMGSGLMVRSVAHLVGIERGMRTDGVLTGLMQLYHLGLEAEDPVPQRLAFFERLLARLREQPGVEAAAVGTAIPGGGRFSNVALAVTVSDRESEEPPEARYALVSPGYFETLGTPVLRGRVFAESDGGGRPVVIVNRTLSELHFPDTGPVGKTLSMMTAEGWSQATVVGVVADALGSALDRGLPTLYAPLAEARGRGLGAPFVLIKSREATATLGTLLEERVAAVEPRVSVHEIRPLEELTAQQTWTQRTLRTVLLVLAGAALMLASIGLYAVLAFTVERRTHELGIRAAVGARAIELRRLVLRDGALQVGVGLALGLAVAALGTRFLGSFLFGVQRHDALVLLAVLGALAATGLLASLRPALRAGRVAPAEALRYE